MKDIFQGKVKTWKDVGGSDAPVIIYGRESSSGTYDYFKEHVLAGEDFSPTVQTLQGTAAIINAVGKDANGIGYGGAAYAKGVRDLALATAAGKAAVMPTAATVRDGSYPLSRPLFFYTRTKPAGDAKLFVDWVLSPEGQALTTKVGYFPLN